MLSWIESDVLWLPAELLNEEGPVEMVPDDPVNGSGGMCDVSNVELRSPLFELDIPAPSTEGEALFVLVMSDALCEVPLATLLSCICLTFEPGIIDTPEK